MARRAKEWDEVLQRELRNPRFARRYIEAALDEGLPLHLALAQVIRAVGVAEYSEKTGIATPNIHRVLRRSANPTVETLAKLLAPLGLKLGVMTATHPKRRRAA